MRSFIIGRLRRGMGMLDHDGKDGERRDLGGEARLQRSELSGFSLMMTRVSFMPGLTPLSSPAPGTLPSSH